MSDTSRRPLSPARDAVNAFYRDVLAGGQLERLEYLVAADYVPHVADFASMPELAPGIEALRRRIERSTPLANEPIFMIEDGNRVFAYVKYPGREVVAGVDIFRLDAQGRIAEHWAARQPVGSELESAPRWVTNGPVPAASQSGPDRLKRRLRELLERVWMQGGAQLVPDYYAESYVQHNPDMPGGYVRIAEIVATEVRDYIERSGAPFPVTIHQMGAEGDLVFVYISIFMAGINRNAGMRSTNVDVFRFDDQGRTIEHWDVLQMESEPLPDHTTLF